MPSTNTVSLASPVAAQCSYTAGVARKNIKGLSHSLTTGLVDPQKDPSGALLGSALQETAAVGRAVAKAAKYASGLTDSTLSTLNSARDQVTALRAIIASANSVQGADLAGLDAQYKRGLQTLQATLTNADFNGRKLFDHDNTAANTNVDIRVGVSMTDKLTVILKDLREVTLNIRHSQDVVGVANAGTSIVGNMQGVAASTIAGVAGAGNALAGFLAAGIAIPVATIASAGLLTDTAGGGATYAQHQVIGSVLNTLQAVDSHANTAKPGVIEVNGGGAGAGNFLPANTLSSAQQNQGVADGMMRAMGDLLSAAITEMQAQKANVDVAIGNLEQSNVTVTQTADEFTKANLVETSSELLQELVRYQSSIFMSERDKQITQALLELIRG